MDNKNKKAKLMPELIKLRYVKENKQWLFMTRFIQYCIMKEMYFHYYLKIE